MKFIGIVLIMSVFLVTACEKEEDNNQNNNNNNNNNNTCDTTNISFSGDVQPIITTNCATSASCHASGSFNGDYTTYAGLKAKVDAGTFKQRVLIDKNMPPTTPLSDCDLNKLQAWLDAGAPNN